MVSLFKKQLLMLALIAGIAVPVSAMDHQGQSEAGWFGWKTAASVTILVGACACWVYSNWNKPVKKSVKPGGKPEIFATAASTPAQQSQMVHPDALKEETALSLKEQVALFTTLNLMDQKIELASQISKYVESPNQELIDLIMQYVQVYFTRVKSGAISIATNKLFAAKNKQVRQEESKKIKQLLGLV